MAARLGCNSCGDGLQLEPRSQPSRPPAAVGAVGGCSDNKTAEAAHHLPARRTVPPDCSSGTQRDGPTPRGAVERDSLVERTAQQLRRIARKPLRQRDARSAIEATIRKLQKSVDTEKAQLQRMTAKNSRDQSMATLLRHGYVAR